MSETGALPAGYPRELERELVLRDGARLHVRPIRVEDAPRLMAFHERLSAHTAYQRFFTVMRRLPVDWARFLATVDYHYRLALIAESGYPETPELIAVARYESTNLLGTAEVAFVVMDGWQGRGIGTALLGDLLAAGEARGIRQFRAWVLADNARMLDMLIRFTDVQERRVSSGVVELSFTRRREPAGAPREKAAPHQG